MNTAMFALSLVIFPLEGCTFGIHPLVCRLLKEIIQGQGHANRIQRDDNFLCDKCNKQFPDIESLYQHKTKDHGTSYQCDVCKELEAREATGIGYICCVCDAEFEIATELEYHISMHDNVLPHK